MKLGMMMMTPIVGHGGRSYVRRSASFEEPLEPLEHISAQPFAQTQMDLEICSDKMTDSN